ncbi:MAG: hypothetical protein QM768_18915 [Agriterribacter sp.]
MRLKNKLPVESNITIVEVGYKAYQRDTPLLFGEEEVRRGLPACLYSTADVVAILTGLALRYRSLTIA